MIFSPHRDDAAFSLSLAVRAWLAAGHRVEVVNCFVRSEFAPYSDAESLHGNDRLPYVTAVRLREDERWRKSLGVGLTLSDLNLKDAPLRLHRAVDEVRGLEVNLAEKGVVKVQKAVERLTDQAILLPLALGGHVDHTTVREAARLALGDGAAARMVAFYEDMPEAAGAAAAEMGVAAGELELGLRPMFVGEAGEVETAVAWKRRTILAYDSQVDGETMRGMAEASRQYGGRERLWGTAAFVAAGLAG